MSRRELWETIIDILDAVSTPEASELGITVTTVELSLPVEVVLQPTEVGFKVLIDAPSWRQDAGIQHQKGRLSLRLAEAEHE